MKVQFQNKRIEVWNEKKIEKNMKKKWKFFQQNEQQRFKLEI